MSTGIMARLFATQDQQSAVDFNVPPTPRLSHKLHGTCLRFSVFQDSPVKSTTVWILRNMLASFSSHLLWSVNGQWLHKIAAKPLLVLSTNDQVGNTLCPISYDIIVVLRSRMPAILRSISLTTASSFPVCVRLSMICSVPSSGGLGSSADIPLSIARDTAML